MGGKKNDQNLSTIFLHTLSLVVGLLLLVLLHELSTLLRHLFFYYLLVLRQCLLNLLICQFPLVNFHFALVFQCVYLFQKHFAAGFLLLVDLIRAQSFLNLVLNLQEFLLSRLHHPLRQVLIVVLQFTNRFQLLYVCFNLLLICTLKVLSVQKHSQREKKCMAYLFCETFVSIFSFCSHIFVSINLDSECIFESNFYRL